MTGKVTNTVDRPARPEAVGKLMPMRRVPNGRSADFRGRSLKLLGKSGGHEAA